MVNTHQAAVSTEDVLCLTRCSPSTGRSENNISVTKHEQIRECAAKYHQNVLEFTRILICAVYQNTTKCVNVYLYQRIRLPSTVLKTINYSTFIYEITT